MISRSTLIAALVVVELAILGMAAKAVGSGASAPSPFRFRPHFGVAFDSKSAPKLTALDKTFATGPAPHVVLDVDNANVTVQAGPVHAVHVQGTMRVTGPVSASRVQPALTAVQTSDGVRVSVESGLVYVRRGRLEREVRITVPPDAQVEILSAAEVSSSGLHAKLVVHAGGALRIANHRGDVDVTTSSGDVEMFDVEGPAIAARTDDGALKLTSSGADRIDAHTGSGAITAVGLRAADGALTTDDGRIDLTFAAQSDATVNLHTDDGRITVAGAVKPDGDSADTRSVRLGSGRGSFTISTASGPIAITQGANV